MINVSLDLYKTFYMVAKLKSMTLAADELMVSQPAVSKSIKTLEDQVGVTLFNRSNKGLELTEEGKMLYERIEPAIILISNAENQFNEFKDLNIGEIKIGISSVLTKCLLTNLIYEFGLKYPNIKISIINGLTNELIEKLNKGHLDFVIFNESHKVENNVDLEKLTSLDYKFFYNPKYFSNINPLKLKDIEEYPLILQPKESNTRMFLEDYCKKNFNPKLEVVSQDLICHFVRKGLGIGFAFENLIDNDLVKVNFGVSMTTNIFLAKNKSLEPSFASKIFIKELKKSLKK